MSCKSQANNTGSEAGGTFNIWKALENEKAEILGENGTFEFEDLFRKRALFYITAAGFLVSILALIKK